MLIKLPSIKKGKYSLQVDICHIWLQTEFESSGSKIPSMALSFAGHVCVFLKIFFMHLVIFLLNPSLTSDPVNPYHLDESISSLDRAPWSSG